MTIEKGRDWGTPHDGPAPTLFAVDDADMATKAHANRGTGSVPHIVVGPGDVAAGLGLESATFPIEPDGRSADRYRAHPMDLGILDFGDGPNRCETVPFVAKVIGRRRRWSWPELIIMNGPVADGRRLGLRVHPNDGRLEITTGTLPWRQGREAARRARTGSHLPHPFLTVERTSSFETTAPVPLDLSVDGVSRGRWRWVRATVIPDGFVLLVPGRPPDGQSGSQRLG